jgi:hypothetical protein
MINVLLIILLIIVAILIIINLCLNANNNSIHVSNTNKNAIKKGGMVITYDGDDGSISAAEYLADPNNFDPETGKLTIHPHITKIGECTFRNHQKIKSITIIDRPDPLIIEKFAFFGCNITGELIIPSCILVINMYTFHGNRNLTSVNIIDRPTPLIIGEFSFCSCNITGELIIPPCVLEIRKNAFYINKNLTSINIIDRPGNLPPLIIGEAAFKNCPQLSGILVLIYVSNIGDNAFYKSIEEAAIYYPVIHPQPFEYVILSPQIYEQRVTELPRMGIEVIDNDDTRIIEYNPNNYKRQKAALELATGVNWGYLTKKSSKPIPISEIKAIASNGGPKYNTISVLGNPRLSKEIIQYLG